MSEKFSSTLSFYLRGLAVITALFLATLAVYAQSNATDGALYGYVLDESGAIIPGAKIVARNVQTNVELTANADGQGYFRFPLLRVGSYEIVANDRPLIRERNDVKGPDYFQIDFRSNHRPDLLRPRTKLSPDFDGSAVSSFAYRQQER